ncbi:MAG: hypothetical protein U1F43_25385 [Myxococcota bacterium]
MTRALSLVAALVAVMAGASARAAEVDDYPKAIATEYSGGRIGSAVVLCEEAERAQKLSDDATKQTCAQAMVVVGDKLLAAGSPENAKKRWLQAASLDPRLLDDPAFAKKLASVPVDVKPPDVKPPDVKPPDVTPPDIKPPDIKPPEVKPLKPVVVAPPKGPPGDAGPRWSRSLGLGLSVGFDGVLAADVGWLVDEQWLVEVALGIIYPTADVRFRWLGLKRCLTPYVGAGLIVPFGATDRFDLDIGSFRALYELGEALHIDIGLAYTPVHRLDIYLGIAFLTPFDQDHPDTVMFFPQLSGGVSWYF